MNQNKNDQQWSNPKHPVDLSLESLEQIHQEILKYEQSKQNEEKGLPIEVFVEILTMKLKVKASHIKKTLQNFILGDTITWEKFQQLLDNESNVREQLLDWFMYDIKTIQFHENCYKNLDLKPRKRQTERMYNIDKMFEIDISNKTYLLTIFDESTVSVFNQNFEVVTEFKIKSQITYGQILDKAVQNYEKKQEITKQRQQENKNKIKEEIQNKEITNHLNNLNNKNLTNITKRQTNQQMKVSKMFVDDNKFQEFHQNSNQSLNKQQQQIYFNQPLAKSTILTDYSVQPQESDDVRDKQVSYYDQFGNLIQYKIDTIFQLRRFKNGEFQNKIENITYIYKDRLLIDQNGLGGQLPEDQQKQIVIDIKIICKQLFIPFTDEQEKKFEVLQCDFCEVKDSSTQTLKRVQGPYKQYQKGFYCMYCQIRFQISSVSMHCDKHFFDICIVCYKRGYKKCFYPDAKESNQDIIQVQKNIEKIQKSTDMSQAASRAGHRSESPLKGQLKYNNSSSIKKKNFTNLISNYEQSKCKQESKLKTKLEKLILKQNKEIITKFGLQKIQNLLQQDNSTSETSQNKKFQKSINMRQQQSNYSSNQISDIYKIQKNQRSITLSQQSQFQNQLSPLRKNKAWKVFNNTTDNHTSNILNFKQINSDTTYNNNFNNNLSKINEPPKLHQINKQNNNINKQQIQQNNNNSNNSKSLLKSSQDSIKNLNQENKDSISNNSSQQNILSQKSQLEKITSIAFLVLKFIRRLKQRAYKSLIQKSQQALNLQIQKEFTKRIPQSHNQYLEKNADKIKKIWKLFSQIPDQRLPEYTQVINTMIRNQEIHNLDQNQFQQCQKDYPKIQKRKTSQDDILNKSKNQKIRETLSQKQQKLKINIQETKVDLQYLDINPNNLKYKNIPTQKRIQRSFTTKNQETQKPITKTYQFKQKLHINSVDYESEQQILAIALITNEIQIKHIYLDRQYLRTIFTIKELKIINFNQMITHVSLIKNKITLKRNILCIFQGDNNEKGQENYYLRVYEYFFNFESHQDFNFNNNEICNIKLPFNPDSQAYFDELGLVLMNYKGFISIIVNKAKGDNCEDNESQFSFHIYKNNYEHNGKGLAFSCCTYSNELNILIFGTLDGLIVFFNPAIGKTLSIKYIGKKINIKHLHTFYLANQVIAITDQGEFITYDLQRYTILQKFQAIEASQNKDVCLSYSYFSLKKQQLFISAFGLKIWNSYSNENLEFYQQKMRTLNHWRAKDRRIQQISTLDKQGKKEQKEKIKNELFVTQNPKQEQDLITNVYMNSSEFYVYYKQQQKVNIYNIISMKLTYSFILQTNSKITALQFQSPIIIYATEDGNIIIENFYSNEIYETISETQKSPQHINEIVFLPKNSMFYAACTTDTGKLIWVVSNIIKPSQKKESVTDQAHNSKVSITSCDLQKHNMCTGGDDGSLVIYNIQSNIKKGTLYLPSKSTDKFQHQVNQIQFKQSQDIIMSEMAYCILASGEVHEVNASDVTISRSFIFKFEPESFLIYNLQQKEMLVGISKQNLLQVQVQDDGNLNITNPVKRQRNALALNTPVSRQSKSLQKVLQGQIKSTHKHELSVDKYESVQKHSIHQQQQQNLQLIEQYFHILKEEIKDQYDNIHFSQVFYNTIINKYVIFLNQEEVVFIDIDFSKSKQKIKAYISRFSYEKNTFYEQNKALQKYRKKKQQQQQQQSNQQSQENFNINSMSFLQASSPKKSPLKNKSKFLKKINSKIEQSPTVNIENLNIQINLEKTKSQQQQQNQSILKNSQQNFYQDITQASTQNQQFQKLSTQQSFVNTPLQLKNREQNVSFNLGQNTSQSKQNFAQFSNYDSFYEKQSSGYSLMDDSNSSNSFSSIEESDQTQ